MRPVSDAFRAALAESHTAVARVLVLASNLSVVTELEDVVSGAVSTDAERRRSLSLTVANPDGMYTPAGPCDEPDCAHPEHLLNWNRLLRAERGLVINGELEWVTLGTFLVDEPRANSAESQITLQGQDRFKLALLSEFTRPTVYRYGDVVDEVIAAIAQDAGMGDELYRLAGGGRSLMAERVFELGDSRIEAIRALATEHALRVYVDAEGYLVVEPAPTVDTLPPSSWTFARGSTSLLLNVTKGWSDQRLRNHVLVTGEGSDLPPISAEARDLNPDSPAYNPVDGTGPLGDRLHTYSSPMIRDVQLAQDVANALLLEVTLIEETIDVPTVVVPQLEAGDVVSVFDSPTRTSDDYLVDTLTIPLTVDGEMTFQSRRIRSLGVAEQPEEEAPPSLPPDPPPAPTTNQHGSDSAQGAEIAAETDTTGAGGADDAGSAVEVATEGSTAPTAKTASDTGSGTDTGAKSLRGSDSGAGAEKAAETDTTGAGGADDAGAASFEDGTSSGSAASALNGVAYRFRNDNGSETAATWRAAQNTNVSISPNTVFRLRFELQETGGVAVSSTDADFGIQRRVNGGTWLIPNAESGTVLLPTASAFVADASGTTDQLTAGTGTFNGGTVEASNARVNGSAISASGHIEYEFTLTIPSADVTVGDVIEIRLVQYPIEYGGPANRIAFTSSTATVTVAP
jgi:hypothetical protein